MSENVKKRNPLVGVLFIMMVLGIFGSGIVVAVSTEHLDMEIFWVRTFSSVSLTIGFLILMYYLIEGYKKNDWMFVFPIWLL